ncbi:MAG: hypothetical protein EOP11_03970 [Proteobacteria bacterium]|nr:MAG: hypothetical protein EOP11_03970 [Pseudomonadota bacterium]
MLLALPCLAAAPSAPVSNAALSAGIKEALVKLDPAIAEGYDFESLSAVPLEVKLAEGDWAKSWQKPVALDYSFALFTGRLFIPSYFRKSVYSRAGQEIIDDTPPPKISRRQPYFDIEANGHIIFRAEGAGPVILEALAAEGKTLRLYRGATRFEAAISLFLRDLLRQNRADARFSAIDAKNFRAVLKKLEADPVNKEQRRYFHRWRKFADAQEKAAPTYAGFLSAALAQISGAHGATFTTPDLAAARGFAFKAIAGSPALAYGAVLSYDLDARELASLKDEVYAGIEIENGSYVEIGFSGPRAGELLLTSLRDDPILK